jgi:hypothetical protein
MKISDNTINILKNFSSINGSILVRPGNVLKTVGTQRSIYATATVEENFPQQFAIYELPKFLGVLSLFQDHDIDFGEHQLTIASGNQVVNYTYADVSSILAPPEDKKIVVDPADVEFSINHHDFHKVLKAAAVLQVPNIAVVGDGNTIKVCAINSKNPTSDTFSIEVGPTEKIFNMVFRVEYLVKLLPLSYNIKINSKGISSFTGDNIQYFVMTEAESKFNS